MDDHPPSSANQTPTPSQPLLHAIQQTQDISAISFYRSAHFLLRLDTTPFILALLVIVYSIFYFHLTKFTSLSLLALYAILFILTLLIQHWSVHAKTAISFSSFKPKGKSDLRGAYVKAIPNAHRGKTELVPVNCDPDQDQHIDFHTSASNTINLSHQKPMSPAKQSPPRFVFQKNIYLWVDSSDSPFGGYFKEVVFPLHESHLYYINAARASHPQVTGLKTPHLSHSSPSSDHNPSCASSYSVSDDLMYINHIIDSGTLSKKALYGENRLEIPMPTFAELYKEHLLAPFFVFQVFCVGLWMLDEYWQYSAMTLVMMLVFEMTVVKGRLRSLKELRGMRNKPRKIYVFRDKKWIAIMSTDLFPGDIVSVTRSSDPEDVMPCDVLILSGSYVVNEAMLTGESVPLIKEGIYPLEDQDTFRSLDIKGLDKGRILFGGTKILMHTSAGINDATPASKPPDGGGVCFVLRTGFSSSQGILMRTILYSQEHVTANSKEAALFILFLLIFAVTASGYVLREGMKTEGRSRYELLLHCIMIITSVVPPELPMQLALAVNTSLIALSQSAIFCTEPFRIPFAGKVDICCYDKTGTLTTDNIKACGVALPSTQNSTYTSTVQPTDDSTIVEDSSQKNEYPLIPVHEASLDAALVLAGCHSLVHIDSELVGDPLELEALAAIQWSYTKSESAVPKKGNFPGAGLRIVKRNRFLSALQRMSTVVQIEGRPPRVLVKGSAEAIGSLLTSSQLPTGFEETSYSLAKKGMRVLALAYKDLDNTLSTSELKAMTREDAECHLTFAGFVAFECPLRPDSRKIVKRLQKSSHGVVMLTGDALLTAAHVGKLVGIQTKPYLFLEKEPKDGISDAKFQWISINRKVRRDFKLETMEQLAKSYNLGLAGGVLQAVSQEYPDLWKWVHVIKIFARMSPDQKEKVLISMKEIGLTTLMCGDGTNDVGALKQAHVGVALLSTNSATASNNEQNKQIPGAIAPSTKNEVSTETSLRQRKGTIKENTQPNVAPKKKKTALEASMEAKLEELQAQADMEDGPPLVKLGDASIASPFTSKRMSIESCATIIRQGRATLVTTLQMYQILALNCLISAYSLSVLYLDGVKFGDKQMTAVGIVMALAFFMISRAKPLERLSSERPPTSIFSPELFISMLGQFAIHLACLIVVNAEAKKYLPTDFDADLQGEFKANILNSVIFLVSTVQQVSVFVANYKGPPFMQGLFENRALMYSLGGCYLGALVLALEILPDVNEYLQITPFPNHDLRVLVIGILIGNFVMVIVWDRLISRLFSYRRRNPIMKAF